MTSEVQVPCKLYADPKTIFEWFLNISNWCDENFNEGSEDGRRSRVMDSWRRVRMAHPNLLATKDKNVALKWLQSQWCDKTIPSEFVGTEIESRPKTVTPLPLSPAIDGESLNESSDESDDEESEEEDLDEDEIVTAEHFNKYFDSYVKSEHSEDISKWTCQEVNNFMQSIARAGRTSHKDRVVAIAKAADCANIDGKLLIAGGADLLVERTCGLVKWDKGVLKREANHIMKELAATKAAAEKTYWERNSRVAALYKSSKLKKILKLAMSPMECGVLYTVYRTRVGGDRACSLDKVNADIPKRCEAGETNIFKVVSLVTPDDPTGVRHNVIYYRNIETNRWNILTSVDFLQHGEAPPGHWHVNRAPLGEFVPHWGPSNDVVHGKPADCPVWWQLIPKGFKYCIPPERAVILSWYGK